MRKATLFTAVLILSSITNNVFPQESPAIVETKVVPMSADSIVEAKVISMSTDMTKGVAYSSKTGETIEFHNTTGKTVLLGDIVKISYGFGSGTRQSTSKASAKPRLL